MQKEAHAERRQLGYTEAFSELRHLKHTDFMVDPLTFLELMKDFYGFKITRRNLQLYHSPFLHRMLPPPIYMGGHRSWYLHPEHTERLAVIVHLNTKHFMPLKKIRHLLRGFPERHYGILLKDLLTVQDLDEIADHFGRGFEIKDFLFHKISRVLRALDDESDEPESMHDEATRDKVLLRKASEYEHWLHSEKRKRAEVILDYKEEKKGH